MIFHVFPPCGFYARGIYWSICQTVPQGQSQPFGDKLQIGRLLCPGMSLYLSLLLVTPIGKQGLDVKITIIWWGGKYFFMAHLKSTEVEIDKLLKFIPFSNSFFYISNKMENPVKPKLKCEKG